MTATRHPAVSTLLRQRELAHRIGAELRTAPERIPIADAAGRTLAEPVVAACDVPGFDTAAMDGWAVRGAGPWRLGPPITIGDPPPTTPLEAGTARGIGTGAPVPPGPVAVLRAEDGSAENGRLTASCGAPPPGADIRPAGEEFRAGDMLLPAGTLLSPVAVALAAVSGNDTVTVRARPRVRVAVLGGELESSGVPPAGRVRDAFSVSLPPLLDTLGARCETPIRVDDDASRIRAALDAPGVELVVTTGATSHGPSDRLRGALAGSGAELLLDRLAMRPGHPGIVARLPSGALILSLPGNPLAALAAFTAIAVPLLDGMLGRPLRPPAVGIAATEFRNPASVVRMSAYAGGALAARELDRQGSAMLSGLARGEMLAMVPPGGVAPGDRVEVLPLPW